MVIALEAQPITIEAIRIWRTTTKRQTRGRFHSKHNHAHCAVGLLAWEKIAPGFHSPNGQRECPVCGSKILRGAGMVFHWNDDHKLSFKQIADLAEQHKDLVFA